MNSEISMWEGCPVNGDVKEPDAIVETPGLVSFDRSHILSVLETDGDSFVLSGLGANLAEAFAAAEKSADFEWDRVKSIAVAIWCDSAQLPIKEMMVLKNFTSDLPYKTNVLWGVFDSPTLSHQVKVTIIASVAIRHFPRMTKSATSC